jgi:hypothetical protein
VTLGIFLTGGLSTSNLSNPLPVLDIFFLFCFLFFLFFVFLQSIIFHLPSPDSACHDQLRRQLQGNTNPLQVILAVSSSRRLWILRPGAISHGHLNVNVTYSPRIKKVHGDEKCNSCYSSYSPLLPASLLVGTYSHFRITGRQDVEHAIVLARISLQ